MIYGMLWKMEERRYGMGVIRDGCDIRDVVGGAVWTGGRGWGCGWNTEGERDWVGTRVGGGVDGRRRGPRLGVEGCGRGCGWKMEGSEIGCGEGVDGCGRGFGWKMKGSETEFGREFWMEDGRERDWVWTGRGFGWRMVGSDKGVDGR